VDFAGLCLCQICPSRLPLRKRNLRSNFLVFKAIFAVTCILMETLVSNIITGVRTHCTIFCPMMHAFQTPFLRNKQHIHSTHTDNLDGQSQDRSDVSAQRALDAPLPAPFDEEAALRYMNEKNTPSWDNPVSKAFRKLVPKYTDTMDWLDWCKSIQRFKSSGFSHISGSVRWRLALRHLPTKYYDIVLNTVMSPGVQGFTWKSFVDTINRQVSAQSEVQRAQKSVRNFSAMKNESLRNFLMRFMS
jgi:hypothetical protein